MERLAKISRNSEVFIASTHFHAEHTTGYLAFPATAKYVNSNVQEAEFARDGPQQIQTFSGRSPQTAELLKDATGRKAEITFDRDYVLDLGGVRVRFLVVDRRRLAEVDCTSARGALAFLSRYRSLGGDGALEVLDLASLRDG